MVKCTYKVGVNMNNQLIKESLEEESGFSSNVHSIETISSQNNITVQKEYHIPNRYYKEQLVLMPINSKKFYIYWEFTNNTIEKFGLTSANEIKFKVIDSENQLLKLIDCMNDVGEYFVTDLQYTTQIKIVAGFYRDDIFVEILHSNTIEPFNTQINYRQEDELVYMKKERGFREIIRSSLVHYTIGMSSAAYVTQIERLKEYENLSQNIYSSHTLREK